MKKTLLTRLKPEYTNRLNTMTQNGQEIILNMLISNSFWIDLTLKQAMDLVIYFELKSLDEITTLFD